MNFNFGKETFKSQVPGIWNEVKKKLRKPRASLSLHFLFYFRLVLRNVVGHELKFKDRFQTSRNFNSLVWVAGNLGSFRVFPKITYNERCLSEFSFSIIQVKLIYLLAQLFISKEIEAVLRNLNIFCCIWFLPAFVLNQKVKMSGSLCDLLQTSISLNLDFLR